VRPALKNASFVAPCATVVGKVNIGASSSVWYGAVLRGDVNTIKIGDNVSVGDRVMVHCSGLKKEHCTTIGDHVQLRPGAIIHGATLEDGVCVGEGAQVMDGGRVGKNSVLLPGAVLPPGKSVPAGEVWGGCPAKKVRALSAAEAADLAAQHAGLAASAVVHAAEQAKSWQELLLDEEEKYQVENRQPYYYLRRDRAGWAEQFENPKEASYPGRIFNSPLSGHKHTKPFRPE
jgi:gamma-carbonic anhydrase